MSEVVGGQPGIAQFLLDDGAGGVPEPVWVQLGDLVGGAEAVADQFGAPDRESRQDGSLLPPLRDGAQFTKRQAGPETSRCSVLAVEVAGHAVA